MTTRNGTPRNGAKARPQPTTVDRRVRLVGAVVALEVVTDDGTNLSPLPVDPIRVPADQWPPDVPALLADLERRVNAELPAEADASGT